MAAFQRKTCEEERELEVEIEKKNAANLEDRLSDLPEALQLRILCCLDTRQAVQTSMLSKTWVSVWTRMPVLELNYLSSNGMSVFRKFVNKVLRSRDPLATLHTLKYKVDGSCRPEMFLKSVFYYAFLRRVKHLEASIKSYRCDGSWPVSFCDSLTSLKLQVQCGEVRCPFHGPRGCILFKNLTVLHLDGALITDPEPFSVFPVLKSLTLINCHVDVELSDINRTLKVHSLGLSYLNISNCTGLKCIDLKTPSLRLLEYRGCHPVKHSGLTGLETLRVDFSDCKGEEAEKKLIDHLMSLFCSLPDVKSLTVFRGTVLLLSKFQDEMARGGCSPFRELKELKMDLSEDDRPKFFLKEYLGWFHSVRDYFAPQLSSCQIYLLSPQNQTVRSMEIVFV